MDDSSVERLADLEARVARLEVELAGLRPVSAPTEWPQPPPPTIDQRILAAPESTAPDRAGVVWEVEAVLKWVGIGLVVLAVGFAVSTAISRGWIGPGLQLLGAVVLSGALIGVGLRLRPTRPGWTHALCTGGVLALFTTFASNLFLDQASTEVAYGLTAATALAGIAIALYAPSQWVAAGSVVGSIVGWAVIGDGEPPVAVTSAVLVVGAVLVLVISELRRWLAVRFTAHAAVMAATVLLAATATSTADRVGVLVAGGAVILSMAWLPSSGTLESGFHQLEVQLATLLGPFAFGVVALAFELDGDTSRGIVGLAGGVALAGLALGLRPRLVEVHVVSLLIASSIAVSIGFAFLLSTTVAVVAIAIQGAGLLLLSRMLEREIRVLANAAVLLAVAAAFVAEATVDGWRLDAPVGDDLGHLVIIAALGAACWLFWEPLFRWLGAALVLALSLSWLGSVLVHLPQGQALVSISWAVVGVAILATGAAGKIPELGVAGLAVLALTVGKLLTVDLTEVDTLWRAALFLVVGLGLMRLGFMLPALTGGRDWRAKPGGPASIQRS